MNTLQNRLAYLDNKIGGEEQLITMYENSDPLKNTEEIKYHTNLIKYYKQRKALIIYEALKCC